MSKILLQHSDLDYRIDLYFYVHKLAIKADVKGHTERDERKENEREEKIKKELSCRFIRINPDKKDYDERIIVNQIKNQLKNQLKSLL